jgi:hypothetical protein
MDKPTVTGPAAGPSVVGLFFGWKVIVSALLLLVYFSTPRIYNLFTYHYYTEFKSMTGSRSAAELPLRAAAPFSHWDGQNYLGLAEYGYDGFLLEAWAFYPLLPMLMRAGHVVVHSYFGAGMLVLSLAAFGFLWFYVRLGCELLPANGALLAALLVLCFPTAFFLATIYTEALFLCLLFGFLYFFEVRRSLVCLVFAFLLPLCRAQGFFLPVALIGYVAWQYWRGREALPPWRLVTLALVAFALGIGSCLLFYKVAVGDALAAFHAQQNYIFANRLSNLFAPLHFLRMMQTPSEEFFAYRCGIVDRGFIVLMLAAIPLVLRLRNRLWSMLYLVLAVVPALMGEAGSYARFALVAFPFVSFALVHWLAGQREWVFWLAAASAAVQGVFIYRFAVNLWVG